MKSYTIQQLAMLVGAKIHGSDSHIHGVAALDSANTQELTFIKDNKYSHELAVTKAGAVLLTENFVKECPTTALVVANPELCFAKIAKLFTREPQRLPGIHPTAVIGRDCEIDPSVHIAPYVVIGDRVKIGANTVILANTCIDNDCKIGTKCLFYANVTLYHEVVVGNRVILHSGVVLGADGFGLVRDQKHWEKIPQLGSVVLYDDVEVGANTTIDRGALKNTIVGQGVKLDNQIQIGHNVEVGDHTVMAGMVGVAGSTKIGKNCMIGGQAGINGHITLADGTIIAATSSVMRSTDKPGVYMSGFMALPANEWKKKGLYMLQVDDLFKRVKKLESLQHERDE